MIKPLALLSIPIGVLMCQQSEAAGAEPNAMRRCDTLAPHAAASGCRYRVAAASRARMLRAFAANRRNAGALDAEYDRYFSSVARNGGRSFTASLNASQAAWEKYAQAQCNYEGDKSFGGSGGGDFEAECKDRLNRQRLTELKSLLATDRDNGVNTSRK